MIRDIINTILIKLLLIVGVLYVPTICARDNILAITDLTRAIEIAIQHNHKIKLAINQIQQAQSHLQLKQGIFLPSIDYSLQANHIDYQQDSSIPQIAQQLGINYTPQSSRNYEVSSILSIAINIYKGGQDAAHLAIAELDLELAKLKHNSHQQEIIIAICTAFWDIQKYQISAKHYSSMKNFHTEQLNIATQQFNQGLIEQSDLSKSKLDLIESEQQLLRYRHLIAQSFHKYLLLLGVKSKPIEINNIPVLTDNLYTHDIATQFPILNSHKNASLTQAKISLAKAYLLKQIAAADFYPKVDLVANTTRFGIDSNNINNAFTNLEKEKDAIGIVLSWNLFNGLQTKSTVKKSYLAIEELTIDYNQQKLDVAHKLYNLNSTIGYIKEKISTIKNKIQIAQEKLALAKKTVLLGNLSQLQVKQQKIEIMQYMLDVELEKIKLKKHKIQTYLYQEL